jgi:conjugative relaxase-like TrwC/TraI family protein
MSLGGEAYYLALATEDYYLDGGEPPGKWLGSGAEQLGLSGDVLAEHLKPLMQGFDLAGEPLVRNAGKTTGPLRRKPGWDLTFSAPKSVSLLWSQLDEHNRRRIQEAHAAAVKRAIEFIEDRATFSRLGKGGAERAAAKLVVASFEHGTSRALDPQLHTHCLLLNFGVCSDGRVRALVSNPFYQNKMLAGAIYRLELAHQLTRTLGLRLERKNSWFEIAGVSAKAMEHYSKRRNEIERELGELGIDTASAAAYATLKTRKVKDLVPPRHELFERWQHEGPAVAFGPASAYRLLRTGARHQEPPTLVRKAIYKALVTLTEHRSYLSERDLLLETAHQLQGSGITPTEFLRRFERELPQTIGLCRLGVRNGEHYLATDQALACEKLLLDVLDNLSKRRVRPVAESRVADLLASPVRVPDSSGKSVALTLSAEQKRAVAHLVLGESPVKVVTGLAGTGKTAMLAATREAFQSAGYQVVGVTPTHRARQELARGAGIDTDTIRMRLLQIDPTNAYLLRHHARQFARAAKRMPTYQPDRLHLSHKTVLILDEASMVRTEDMQQLLSAVEQRGGRVLIIGDDRQLPPVGPGGAFGAVIRRLGSVDLTNVTRQKEPWAKEATKAIAKGDAEGFLRAYAERGYLRVERTRPQVETALLVDWKAGGGAFQPERHVIAASTNQQVDAYNRAAQKDRIAAGLVATRHSLRVGEETFYAGDRITFQKNSRKLNVFNGDTGTILAVKDWGWTEAIAVRLDRPERTLGEKAMECVRHTAAQLLREAAGKKTYRYAPNDYDIRIIPLSTLFGRTQFATPHGPNSRPPIRLAYAFTTHKLQGATLDNTYVALGDSMTDREMAYVQGSRHRQALRLYATEFAAGQSLTDLVKTRQKPQPDHSRSPEIGLDTSPLAKQMKRSRKQSLAHDADFHKSSAASQDSPAKTRAPEI